MGYRTEIAKRTLSMAEPRFQFFEFDTLSDALYIPLRLAALLHWTAGIARSCRRHGGLLFSPR